MALQTSSYARWLLLSMQAGQQLEPSFWVHAGGLMLHDKLYSFIHGVHNPGEYPLLPSKQPGNFV